LCEQKSVAEFGWLCCRIYASLSATGFIMSFEPSGIAQALVLISAANGAPILTRKLFEERFAQPVDGGLLLPDQQPLFGPSKTWRGLIVAVACTAMVAPLLGLSAMLGAKFGALSISADLLASFTKRRLGFASSSRARLLDVFPEALLPILVLHSELGLGKWDIVLTVLIFFVLEASISPLLFRWHIRNRPY
jgi:CDP-2,3-bis-(O-geranylgeranyl)-sn-glycerol synthase